MSSTYSPDLRIELIGTGDQAGVWGSTTNNNIGTFIENAVAGYTSVSIAASPQALTANDGAADEARFAAIALTTVTGANFTVCIPPNSKLYTFYNASSYTATISNSTVKNGTTLSGGTTVAIPAGKTMSVWSDGTNVAQQTNHLISPTIASATLTTPALGTPSSGTLTNATGLPIVAGTTGTLSVARGGTGVATSTGSGNVVLSTSPTLVTPVLGTPSSGTLTSCTGLPLTTGVTGTLPVANGGTGVTTSTGSGNVVLSASPTFTGTPLAPTAAAGTSTTQIATTAFVAAALLASVYPVGSIYTNASVATNPGTLLGFGTWAAFGAGRVAVGFDAGNALFDTAEETGGSYNATLVSHDHTATSTFTGSALGNHTHGITDPGHLHGLGADVVTETGSGPIGGISSSGNMFITQTQSATTGITATDAASAGTPAGSVSTSVASSGSSATNANIQPYITVYMWKRTA